jgi:UDP-glucose 6-dehydrogenase
MDIKAPDFSDTFKKEEAVVGIVGMGLVGRALKFYFERHGFPVLSYDRYREHEFDSLEKIVKSAQVVFVTVLSPMKDDRTRNNDGIVDVLADLRVKAREVGRPFDTFVVCIVSPTNPGFTRTMQRDMPDTRIVCMPEFLTSKNADLDLVRVNRFIVGGAMDDSRIVLQFFLEADRRRVEEGKCALIQSDPTAAEISRLFVNGALLVKALFAKRIHDICTNEGVDFEEVRVLSCLDPRVGAAFTKVEDVGEREVEDDYAVVAGLDERVHEWPGD